VPLPLGNVLIPFCYENVAVNSSPITCEHFMPVTLLVTNPDTSLSLPKQYLFIIAYLGKSQIRKMRKISPIRSSLTLSFFFLWYWRLNSGLCVC
jgi:hypothetical protein